MVRMSSRVSECVRRATSASSAYEISRKTRHFLLRLSRSPPLPSFTSSASGWKLKISELISYEQFRVEAKLARAPIKYSSRLISPRLAPKSTALNALTRIWVILRVPWAVFSVCSVHIHGHGCSRQASILARLLSLISSSWGCGARA